MIKQKRAISVLVIIFVFTHIALVLFLYLFLQNMLVVGGIKMKIAIIFVALMISLEYWHNMFVLIRLGDEFNHGTMKRLSGLQKVSTMTTILVFMVLIFILLSDQVFYGVLGIVQIVIIILDGILCDISLKLYRKLQTEDSG